MKLQDIKNEMLSYKDLYGQSLLEKDAINKCKSKKELAEIIDNHDYHIEQALNDAQASLNRFKIKLGLHILN